MNAKNIHKTSEPRKKRGIPMECHETHQSRFSDTIPHLVPPGLGLVREHLCPGLLSLLQLALLLAQVALMRARTVQGAALQISSLSKIKILSNAWIDFLKVGCK